MGNVPAIKLHTFKIQMIIGTAIKIQIIDVGWYISCGKSRSYTTENNTNFADIACLLAGNLQRERMPDTITVDFFTTEYFSGYSIFSINLCCSSHFFPWNRHYAQVYSLPRIYQRSKKWIITWIIKILRAVICLFVEETFFSGWCHCR